MPKTEHMERPVTDFVYFGILGEDEVADTFALLTGKRVQRWRRAYRLKDSVMLAHTDRKVVGEEALLEAKTTNAFAKWAWEASVPDMYHIQCQALLLTSGHKRCYFATRIAGQSYYHTYIEPHAKQQEALRYACERFWKDHVEGDKAPTPTTQDDFSRIYHDAGTVADYEEEIHRVALANLRATRIAAKEADAAKKEADAQVKILMGDQRADTRPSRKAARDVEGGREAQAQSGLVHHGDGGALQPGCCRDRDGAVDGARCGQGRIADCA